MDVDRSRFELAVRPWVGIALLSALWIGMLAVLLSWWPAGSRNEATAYVRHVPAAAAAGDRLATTREHLTSDRSLLHAAESLAGRYPSPTAAGLVAFRDALQIDFRRNPALVDGTLVLHYAGNLPQGRALVEALAYRFAVSQGDDTPLPVTLADTVAAGDGQRAWTVGLLVMLTVVTGGWCLGWWRRGDRPLASARQAEALLGVPVLAVDWRQ